MNSVRISYLKVMAVAAVLAITLIGLSGLLNMTSRAQDRVTLPTREINLLEKIKDKKFADGRRVEIHALPDGEKIVAEIKNGEFLKWLLVTPDGTEVQGEVKKKHVTTTTSTTCYWTTTYTRTKTVNGVTTTTVEVVKVEIPCPPKLGT
jgi:hypothetical protein